MKTTAKVFLACGIGGFIGSLVALQLQHNWWWIGMLVGGLAGYLSYEFKRVCQAVPEAFKSACDWKFNKTGSPLFWRLFWKSIAVRVLACYLIGFWISILFIVIGVIERYSSVHFKLLNFVGMICISTIVVGTIAIPVFFFIIWNDWRDPNALETAFDENVKFLKYCNPVYATISTFKILLRGLIASPALIPITSKSIMFVGKFFKNLFVLIHSDMRILCGIDSAFGAAIGYYCGNAIIGAITGAVLGVFNYKIVSLKLLHLDNIKT